MSFQEIAEGQVSPEVPINENMAALGQAFLWTHDKPADTGLTVGFSGGTFDESTIADTTVACTNDATNYVVAHRTSHALSVSTATTNWDNTTTYGRVARAVFASGVLTFHDERLSPGGILDNSAAAVGAVTAGAVSIVDAGAYYTGTDVEAALQELGAAGVAAQPFDVHAFYPGVPTASAKVLRVPVARAVEFPANFAGSYGKAGTAATGSTVFAVQVNGASVGSITFGAASATATFATTESPSVPVDLVAGDVLSIIAPATPDATLADIGFVLAGTR